MTLRTAVRNSFITGLVLIAPLLITVYILQVLSGVVFSAIEPVVQESNLEQYTANVELVAQLIAIVAIVITIVALGFLAQRKIGQRLFGSLGRFVAVVPVVRTIYTAVRQISGSFTSGETSFDSLVLVEFPRMGVYAVGLVTGKSPAAVREVTGEPTRNVFLPSSPNPAGGRLVFVPETQIHEVDMSVREGLGIIMTTGAGREQTDTLPPSSVAIAPEEATDLLEEAGDREEDPGGRDADRDDSDDEGSIDRTGGQ